MREDKDPAKMSARELRMELAASRAKLVAMDEMFGICKYMVDSTAESGYIILGVDPKATIAGERPPPEGVKTKRLREIVNGWAES